MDIPSFHWPFTLRTDVIHYNQWMRKNNCVLAGFFWNQPASRFSGQKTCSTEQPHIPSYIPPGIASYISAALYLMRQIPQVSPALNHFVTTAKPPWMTPSCPLMSKMAAISLWGRVLKADFTSGLGPSGRTSQPEWGAGWGAAVSKGLKILKRWYEGSYSPHTQNLDGLCIVLRCSHYGFFFHDAETL